MKVLRCVHKDRQLRLDSVYGYPIYKSVICIYERQKPEALTSGDFKVNHQIGPIEEQRNRGNLHVRKKAL